MMLSPASRDILFWVFVAICVVAQAGILRPVVAPRAAPAARPGVPATRRAVEALWTIVPAVGLALLLVLTWRAMRGGEGPAVSAPAVSVMAAGSGAAAR